MPSELSCATKANLSLDCLVVGDGCIGWFIAQKLKRNSPALRIAIKARQTNPLLTPSNDRAVHKTWLKARCEAQGVLYLQDYSAIDGAVKSIIITTKSDDVQQAAQDLTIAKINAAYTLLVYNGMLASFNPAFPGITSRAIPPAGYAFDTQSNSGLKVVNGDAPWSICVDGQQESGQDAISYWIDFLAAGGQSVEVDDSHGLRILRKYLINTAVNPLTVIYQRTVDELLDDPLTRQRMRDILLETIPIIKADEHFVDARSLMPSDKQLLTESFAFIETYRGHYTSAYHAFMAGDKIEIASLTLYAIVQGRKLGLSTRENQRVEMDIHLALAHRDSGAAK